MKTSLEHLPQKKQNEIKIVKDIICDLIDAEFVILFGSYARGDWVEDRTVGNDSNVYEYKSDYDILIVTKNPRRCERDDCPERIENKAAKLGVRTYLSIIFHSPKKFKRAVNKGKYFFVDIINEGIMLHSSGRMPLPEVEELTLDEQKHYAQEDFKNWFESAASFLITYDFVFKRKDYRQAAFLLHQAAERFYSTAMLVFTGYKPKLHDLEKLDHKAQALSKEFRNIFPKSTQKEKDLFDLLKRAYVDARYDMSYKITREELEYLAERVKLLQQTTEEVCKAKIKSFSSQDNDVGSQLDF
jgi:HEPN domain-containing protein/predicted nucleotidyltransferase